MTEQAQNKEGGNEQEGARYSVSDALDADKVAYVGLSMGKDIIGYQRCANPSGE